MKNHSLLSALTLMICLFSSIAAAFRLDPMVAELSPTSPGNSRVFRVENNGQERIAIELKVTSRRTDTSGKEVREPVSDFSIYPQQLSLAPNDSRSVRLTYNGPKDLKSEKAYRLIATQLPVDFKGEKKPAQLHFLFQYIASVYIRPTGVFAKLQVTGAVAKDTKKAQVTIANTGTAHRLLKDVSLDLLGQNGQAIEVEPASLQNWPSENILAGESRTFEIQTRVPIPLGEKLDARIQIKDEK